MTISYPLALPSTKFIGINVGVNDVVGKAVSPFTLTQQVQRHQGQAWELEFELPPMERAEAEQWITWFMKLKGMYGTFLAPAAVNRVPAGTWAGTPVLNGNHAALSNEINLGGLTVGATVKAGDYLQLGSGNFTRLHKLLEDGTADVNGEVTAEIWPNIREALLDGDAVVFNNAVGVFRLASNNRRWELGNSRFYSMRFAAVEAL